LNPSAYVGSNPTALTWDNNDRGYDIDFTNSTDYEIEWPVDISIYVEDNALNM